MANLSQTVADMVYDFLAKRDGLDQLPEIIQILKSRYDMLPSDQVLVTTAISLSPETKKQLSSLLSQRLGSGNTVIFKTDKSIVGGLVIRHKDKIIDLSLNHRLNKIREELENDN